MPVKAMDVKNAPKDENFTCSFCRSNKLSQVIDFGNVALAGGFIRQEHFSSELKFRLRVLFCNDCFSVQVVDKINPDELFREYFYFSSSIGTLKTHFLRYAEEITKRFLKPENSIVVEFGCNDGVLLRPLADQNIKTVIGVDPAKNVVSSINDERVHIYNDYFTQKTAKEICKSYGNVSMIVANNVYAHIPNIQDTTYAIEQLLDKDGVFIFEVHYLGNVIDDLQYDMIYHEHLYYYSLLSAKEHFKRYNMIIFDVERIPIHAGSIRFYVCKEGSKYSIPAEAVSKLELEERRKGYSSYETFLSFSELVYSVSKELIQLLVKLRSQGKRIAGYGASGRANTMIQYCGISHDHIDYIIDDAPAKVGFYTPGSHFLIVSNQVLMEEDAPDYVLIFAWAFLDEISNKNSQYLSKGGKFIVPLPTVSIHEQND